MCGPPAPGRGGLGGNSGVVIFRKNLPSKKCFKRGTKVMVLEA